MRTHLSSAALVAAVAIIAAGCGSSVTVEVTTEGANGPQPQANLPLEFLPGENRHTYAIDGTETYDVVGEPTPRAALTLVINRRTGERVEVPVRCRLDTAEEVSIYKAGGVLQRFAEDFLQSEGAA